MEAVKLLMVSIHAPVKGATKTGATRLSQLYRFNPRTREGCDGATLQAVELNLIVSIHAPVKGATVLSESYRSSIGVSIHAPVKGATLAIVEGNCTDVSFNPRTREGCDFV